MVVVFIPNKKGGSSKAIDYLLNHREKEGTARTLKGDPQLTRDIINNIKYKQKATVGVLSFEEDNIDESLKYKLMEEFENMLMPSFDKTRYNILWVEHRDKGRLELNFVIHKIELLSGRSFNPFYFKSDLPRVEKWQDLQNNIYGFTNPKDPSKTRTLSVNSSIKKFNTNYEKADKHFHNLVEDGKILNRTHLIELCKENGIEVTRVGKDYMSIKLPDSKKARKFKGGIYSEEFTSIREFEAISDKTNGTAQQFSNRDIQRECEELRKDLSRYIDYKSRELQQRYNGNRYELIQTKNYRIRLRNNPRNINIKSKRNIKDNTREYISTDNEPFRARDEEYRRNSNQENGYSKESIESELTGNTREYIKQHKENIQEDRRTSTTTQQSQIINDCIINNSDNIINFDIIDSIVNYKMELINDIIRATATNGTRQTEESKKTISENDRGLTKELIKPSTAIREEIIVTPTAIREQSIEDYREISRNNRATTTAIITTAETIREQSIANSRELSTTRKSMQQSIRDIENTNTSIRETTDNIIGKFTKLREFGKSVEKAFTTTRGYINRTLESLKQRYFKEEHHYNEDTLLTKVYDEVKDTNDLNNFRTTLKDISTFSKCFLNPFKKAKEEETKKEEVVIHKEEVKQSPTIENDMDYSHFIRR